MDGEGGYNKVKFTATLHNGEEYTGRFDVYGKKDVAGNPNKQDNQFNELCFYAEILDSTLYSENEEWLGYLTTPPESPTTDEGSVSVTLSQKEVKVILEVLERDLNHLKDALKYNGDMTPELDEYVGVIKDLEEKLG